MILPFSGHQHHQRANTSVGSADHAAKLPPRAAKGTSRHRGKAAGISRYRLRETHDPDSVQASGRTAIDIGPCFQASSFGSVIEFNVGSIGGGGIRQPTKRVCDCTGRRLDLFVTSDSEESPHQW